LRKFYPYFPLRTKISAISKSAIGYFDEKSETHDDFCFVELQLNYVEKNKPSKLEVEALFIPIGCGLLGG
jgi:hypothetical protein